MIAIYALVHPVTRECRYVGKSRNLKKRLRAHINRSAKTPGARHCASWISGLIRDGLAPDHVVLEDVPESQWEDAEKHWIAYMRFIGANLTNMTIGGGGENRASPSEVVRKRISEAAKRQFSVQSARDAAAEFARAAWRDPAFAANKTEKTRKISADPDYRRRQSEAKKAKWKDPAYIASVKAGQAKADHRTGAISMWQRPEYRERQRIAREKRLEASRG